MADLVVFDEQCEQMYVDTVDAGTNVSVIMSRDTHGRWFVRVVDDKGGVAAAHGTLGRLSEAWAEEILNEAWPHLSPDS